MRGVMILTPATLLAKLIGLFYKIPLLLIVGVEGMAYFLSAYHVYSLLFVLSAAGLPSALSLLVSRHVASGRKGAVGRIFGVSLSAFLLLGFLGTVTLFLFAKQIAAGLSMREATFSIMAIAPALMLSAFTGAVRGLFQGRHNMVPTAVSEVIEAVGKLLFGITLAYFAKSRGVSVEGVAAAAVFGITLGVLLSALYLALCLLTARKTLFLPSLGAMPSRRALLCEILRVAFPVTVSASVMSLVSLVDTVLISSRLQAGGFAPGIANAMYSSYGNLAVPLYNLVPALLAPITLSLTPTLTAAFAAGDEEGVRDAFSKAHTFLAVCGTGCSRRGSGTAAFGACTGNFSGGFDCFDKCCIASGKQGIGSRVVKPHGRCGKAVASGAVAYLFRRQHYGGTDQHSCLQCDGLNDQYGGALKHCKSSYSADQYAFAPLFCRPACRAWRRNWIFLYATPFGTAAMANAACAPFCSAFLRLAGTALWRG